MARASVERYIRLRLASALVADRSTDRLDGAEDSPELVEFNSLPKDEEVVIRVGIEIKE
jgi:hypothetical protein